MELCSSPTTTKTHTHTHTHTHPPVHAEVEAEAVDLSDDAHPQKVGTVRDWDTL